MTTQELRMMMLDIDGILTHHHATPTDVLTAAQALAVSAIGDLVNKAASSAASVRRGSPASSAAPLHRAADSSAASVRRGLPASSASPFVRCQEIPSPKPPHTKKPPMDSISTEGFILIPHALTGRNLTKNRAEK